MTKFITILITAMYTVFMGIFIIDQLIERKK
jgi:hypothetical protein